MGSLKKHPFKCKCGKIGSIQFMTVLRKRKKRPDYVLRCDSCRNVGRPVHTTESVKSLICKYGAEPQFKEYLSVRQKIEVKCHCGKRRIITVDWLIGQINKQGDSFTLECKTCVRQQKQSFLTEARLAKILDNFKVSYIRDRRLQGSSKLWRPDFLIVDRKRIIEFDGDSHYRKASVILSDYEKDLYFKKQGYVVIRIPYFIQMTSKLASSLVGKEVHFEREFSDGFIHKSACLPADFCELGVKRFLQDLITWQDRKRDIVLSLKDKILKLGELRVIPSSCKNLVEDIEE